MNKKTLLAFLFFFFVCAIFFNKTFVKGYLPFPGDLLMSENPYKADSFLGYAPGGYPNKGQDRDVMRELLPWKQFSITEMKQGRLPFWNPYNFSGSILMQNFQTGIFYPVNIFFFVLPFGLAWSMFIFSQPLLAMIFMFLFLKELQRSTFASLIGGIAFGFSSYMIVWIEYGNIDATFLWLPLMLWSIHRFLRTSSWKYAVSFIVASLVAFVAGYIQGFFYMMVVSFAFAVWIIVETKEWKKLVYFIPAFLLPVGIAGVQLFSTYEVFSVSTRGAYTTSQIQFLLNPLYMLVTIIAPDFFGNPATRTSFLPLTYIERVMYPGMLIVMMSFISLFFVKDRMYRFFMVIAGIVLFLTLQIPGVDLFYKLPIPMLSTSVPTRMLSVFLFSVIILAAYGIDSFFALKKFPKVPFIFLGSIVLMLWGSTFFLSHGAWADHISVMRKGLVIPTILCAAIATLLLCSRKYIMFTQTVLVGVLVIDLFFFFQKITPFAPSSFLYPQTDIFTYLKNHTGIDRFWGYGDANIVPDIETYAGLYGPEGEDPLHNKWYGSLLAASEKGTFGTVIPRPDANIAPGFGTDDLKQNIYRKKLLDTLGVAYVLEKNNSHNSDTSTFPDSQYTLVYSNDNWHVYKNMHVLPRTLLSSDFIVIPDDTQAIGAFYHEPQARKLILSQQPILAPDPSATGEARVISYSPQHIVINASSSADTLLFLSDAYYPAWHATIDGKETPIIRADVALRAIALPKGNHTIVFYFSSKWTQIGWYVSLGSMIVSLLYILYVYTFSMRGKITKKNL